MCWNLTLLMMPFKYKLRAIHQSMNPFKLKDDVERKLSIIFRNVKVTFNVWQRL